MKDKSDVIFASGSRRSGKSIILAQKIIVTMLMNRMINCVVIRSSFNQHKDSTYATLARVIKQMKLQSIFTVKKTPLEIEVRATGQKIVFRGTDDPESVKGLDFSNGGLHLIWFDEITSIDRNAYETITGSFSGTAEYEANNQTLISTNPAGTSSWVKEYFIDKNLYGASVYSFTIFDNKFLSKKDIDHFLKLKDIDFARYRREALGEWVYSQGLVYKWKTFTGLPRGIPEVWGLDWGNAGGSGDPTAIVRVFVDTQAMVLYVMQVGYSNSLPLNSIAQMLPRGRDVKIFADTNNGIANAELMRKGYNIRPMKKEVSKGKVIDGVRLLQTFDIYIDENSRDLLSEIGQYLYDDDGNITTNNKTPDHLLDAMRYAVRGYWITGSRGK
ncbi:terminase [Lactococcus insecticola]|uniref:Terminase n=2 Tax=Pseudolactococcus insecticola TaxID=2709158 RepID=A0A6A0B7S7_9LACT|nr:terminase [Lactococcus insecticola]